VFPDPRLVAAIVDRVTFNAHIIETGTQSYRLRTSKTATRRKRVTRPRMGPKFVTTVGPNHLTKRINPFSPMDPRNLLRVVEAAAKQAGYSGVGVHTLRHSAAVGWLESGTHIKAVADLLGHSSIAITGDVYGHTSDDTARAAVDNWSSALGF
jgi:integrase